MVVVDDTILACMKADFDIASGESDKQNLNKAETSRITTRLSPGEKRKNVYYSWE